MSSLLLLGAGGHGKVVADAAASMQCWERIAFLDDRYPDLRNCLSYPVIGDLSSIDQFKVEFDSMVVAMGDNTLRVKFLEELLTYDVNIAVIRHASALISASATIEPGTVICANAVVNPEVNIGLGSIINTAATVDHECLLGRCIHLSPGVNLGGRVTIGENTWIGIGASVINDITIGDNVMVAAGSVVTTDIQSSMKVAGIPAKPIDN